MQMLKLLLEAVCTKCLLFIFFPSANLSGKLSEYGLIVPFSTDSQGRYISHVVSVAAGSKSGVSAAGRRRVSRSVPSSSTFTSNSQQLFFNVTVFGKELHLRLRANRRLVAPGAFVEWHEDFEQKARERIYDNCVFTGDVTDMPEASVAVSNCDGLVSSLHFTKIVEQHGLCVEVLTIPLLSVNNVIPQSTVVYEICRALTRSGASVFP